MEIEAAAHTAPYKIHKYFARRPWNIFQNLILNNSEVNEIILDPFMGGGVTVYESVFLKRKVIGCDLNPLSKFIVINMLDDKSSLEEFDQACKLVSQYLKDIKFQFNEIKKINWCELTYQVICNECKNKTILSNEQKVGVAKFKCVNKNCISNIQKTYIRPISCERTGYVYLNMNSIMIDGSEKTIQFDKKLELENKKYINYLKEIIYDKKIKIPNDLIPLLWDRQFEDRLFEKNIRSFQDLFTEKNLYLNLILLDFIKNLDIKSNIKSLLRLVFSSSLRDTNIMSFVNSRWQSGKPTTWSKHAYWLPSQFCEVSVLDAFQRAAKRVRAMLVFNRNNQLSVNKTNKFEELKNKSNVFLLDQSIANVNLQKDSIDAIITDPPYGSNVQYLELSSFWNVWNKDLYTFDNELFKEEAISNRKKCFIGHKTMIDYEQNLYKVFHKSFLLLKKNKPLIVTFNNKNMAAWIALLLAIFRSGFEFNEKEIYFQNGVKNYIHTAHTQYKGSPYGDFILKFYKPKSPHEVKSINADILIKSIDKIFLRKELKTDDKQNRGQIKLSLFLKSLKYIESYSKTIYIQAERELIFNYFGKNYLKNIYG